MKPDVGFGGRNPRPVRRGTAAGTSLIVVALLLGACGGKGVERIKTAVSSAAQGPVATQLPAIPTAAPSISHPIVTPPPPLLETRSPRPTEVREPSATETPALSEDEPSKNPAKASPEAEASESPVPPKPAQAAPPILASLAPTTSPPSATPSPTATSTGGSVTWLWIVMLVLALVGAGVAIYVASRKD